MGRNRFTYVFTVYEPFRAAERLARYRLAAGRRRVYEAEMNPPRATGCLGVPATIGSGLPGSVPGESFGHFANRD